MIRTPAWLILLTLVAVPLHAEMRRADPAVLADIVDDEANPLPRGFAPWEPRQGLQWLTRGASPLPEGPVRAQAEYEAMDGIMVRWGSFNSLITEMVVPLTTADPPARVFVVVDDQFMQNSASNALSAAGTDLDFVEFIQAASDSVWMRDYGPRYIDDDGELGIVDHSYNRPRPNDNQIPSVVSNLWQQPLYDIGLSHGGGNFHLFDNREAFMTRLIVNENPGLSEQDIIDRYAAYQGLDLTLTDPLPASFDSTQHIDMWMLPLADNRVLIGEYDAAQGGGVPRSVTEATVADLEGRGYEVFRTPGWQVGGSFGAHYTYTNAVLVNQVALICRFGGAYAALDAAAAATFAEALPDHEIVQVDCSDIIGLSGAIHCIVMHVPLPPEPAVPLPPEIFRDGFDPAPAS